MCRSILEMLDWNRPIKCQIDGCKSNAVFHIKAKEDREFFHLCFEHAEMGKDQNFSKIFLKTKVILK